MRYIRTKETEYGCIIDVKKYKDQTGEDCYIPENEIIKQANTIMELCDLLVGIDQDGHYIIDNFNARIVPINKVEYYGAIWTDKGLLYVAKMNDKGELEIL